MRVAVYGGSFDPPHVGHAMVASWVRWTDLADALWFLPAADHAFGKALSPFPDRCAWLDALCAELGPWASVSTVEGDLPGPNYTIDTLNELRRRHPDARLRLVVGADQRPALPRWRRWDEIEADFSPIWVGRDGYPPETGAPVFPGVSSTEVRVRLGAGDPATGLLTAGVRAAIRRTGVRYRPAP
jgi:nicotinate-nucleotide adenylyltransferase